MSSDCLFVSKTGTFPDYRNRISHVLYIYSLTHGIKNYPEANVKTQIEENHNYVVSCLDTTVINDSSVEFLAKFKFV